MFNGFLNFMIGIIVVDVVVYSIINVIIVGIGIRF